MDDFLVAHALKNVWCTPDQDLQVIYKPARITPLGGATTTVNVLWGRLNLPSSGERYHVYQIGQINPGLIGLFQNRNEWRRLSSMAELERLIGDVYDGSGLCYPRSLTWVLVNDDKNIIIALKEHARLPLPDALTIYIRFYSNAYFTSARSNEIDDTIVVSGMSVDTLLSLVDFQNQMILYRNRPVGYVYCFVNGVHVQDISPITAVIGDYVEWVYDSSILKVVELPLIDLNTFDSELDHKRKYLVHYPKDGRSIIDYRDDVDMFVVRKLPNNRFTGGYFHKNQEDSVRMVTHRDYSVPVQYVMSYLPNDTDTTVEDYAIRVHIRRSGYERPLVFEHNRIHELYKQTEYDINRALLGIDSTVPAWRADHLELSNYTRIMRKLGTEITADMVRDAYGYNAIAKLIGDTPQAVVQNGSVKQATLPEGLRSASLVFEYDINGELLGWYNHLNGSVYQARNLNCVHIEAMGGSGTRTPDMFFGGNQATISTANSYRYYRCTRAGANISWAWEDITDTNLYSIVDNKVVWGFNTAQFYGAVKPNNHVLCYNLTLIPVGGVYKFTLQALEKHGLVVSQRPLTIMPGKIEIWLNKRLLIENLDYFVTFPQIVICNKEYLESTEAQLVVVRCSGFCKSDMTRQPVLEHGFVEHGILSRNRRYDIRDDKVQRISIDGCLKTNADVRLSETDSGVTVPGIANGKPYLIDDIIVPFRGIVGADTYAMKDIADVVDKTVSDYLSIRIPEPVITEPNIIPERYTVFSPFCSKVLYDLKNGILGGEAIKVHYGDNLVHSLVKPYLYLLASDPTQKNMDPAYVNVHPHERNEVVTLNLYQYTFLERVIRLYLNNKVDLTSFARLEIV